MTQNPTTPTSTAPAAQLVHDGSRHADAWWRSAVIYQIYPRSFADHDGDGMGDLVGITSRLPYLRDLGVDAVWLSPFYASPQADAGYDVSDYRAVDPLFGRLEDAKAMVARAHELGLRVIVDLVPNHTSDEHEWFRAALAAAPGSPERERYMFRDGKGPDGSEPPNNWESVFGGRAWTRVTEPDGSPGQWYLHLFDPKQPDLNWELPEVREEFESILRFWLDLGVDGFRVDVAHGLIKEAGLPDWDAELHLLGAGLKGESTDRRPPMWDQDGVHEVYESWRRILNSYNETGDSAGDRIMCAEAWVTPVERAARYVRETEFHQAFNFDFLETHWHADKLREVIRASYAANDSVGAPTTWVLSNHDVVRHASRLGLPIDQPRPNGIGAEDPQPDTELGLRRARAATTLMLALPGGAYIYQGEELGLPDHTTMPDEVRQDPTWERSGHTEKGRDGCRVPMPWEADRPGLGFGPSEQTWLPQPESYRALAADQQAGVPGSTLELYRRMLQVRRELSMGQGSLLLEESTGDVVRMVNDAREARVQVVANLGTDPVDLPDGAQVLVASGALDGTRVPSDTAVWFTA
ncbi:alpha-glucosidase [Barrientosiimonas humi]|uniref:Alpha-glucosidase n=1 Tax=Barrientosiimonas humi TaxID=999931 RepID=A0A542X9U6_9MICO|nr:alpha-glucosidase [Barrientosiimonas humi]CAG7572604.1 Oligo-1,6-glucosidase [Barrientosiimonas humi]